MARANRYKKKENYRLWGIYHGMKKRCYNENCKRYKDYGGRGIKVCSEWLETFDNFADWAYRNGYEENLTIDRIDNDKDYAPDNCRWATNKQQCNNTRRNIKIEYKGETKTISEWCEHLGLNYYTVQKRLKNGWSVQRALEEKPMTENSFSKICRQHNIGVATAYSRIKAGWNLEEALNTPTKGRGAGAKDYGRAETAVCCFCGKEFEKKTAIQKYCCGECRYEASKKSEE